MDKSQRAQDARRESEVMRLAFEAIEAETIKEWASSNPEERELRDRLYIKLLVLTEVRAKLKSFATSGLIAEQNKQA
jgi:hypothetical protein